MSTDKVARLERNIAAHFNRSHCVLLGSGTTALLCAFAYIQSQSDKNKTDVLFPEITCETAVNAAIFAGFTPRFCDVSRTSYVMSPFQVCSIEALGTLAAIVPTHIFGHLSDVSSIEKQLNLPIPCIEDAAQGYGGVLGNRISGSMGLASVISFGPGKLLDCGGGGALLSDDISIVDFSRDIAKTFNIDPQQRLLSRQCLMKEMLSAKKIFKHSRVDLLAAQHRALHINRHGYLSPFDSSLSASVQESLLNLNTIRDKRIEFTNRLDEKLEQHKAVSIPKRAGLPALWRYSVSIDNSIRIKKIEALKKQGYKVSKLFQPCSKKYSAESPQLQNSMSVSKSIININFPKMTESYSEAVDAISRVFNT